MINLLKKIHNSWSSFFDKILPDYFKFLFNPELFSITNFMKFASKLIKPSDRILDAGAGSCPYKKYFSHTSYESTDFEDIFDKSSKIKQDFVCSLDNIPKPNNSYNAIINTQVLEHVESPQKVINEFYRILKPNGKLFLTAPLAWKIHGEPYHFFNFTKYGLESLFRTAGFKIVFIKPRGGIFWFLEEIIKIIPPYIFFQQAFKKSKNALKFKLNLLVLVLFPFYLISLPFCNFLIPLLFFYLDRLDKKQDYTLGYACYCIKK